MVRKITKILGYALISFLFIFSNTFSVGLPVYANSNDNSFDVTEYIADNIDESIVKVKKMDESNAVWVKQTLADGSKMEKNETLDDIMTDINKADAFITMSDNVVYVYNVNDESEYYVSYINTLQDDNSVVRQVDFAKNNLEGEELTNCIYDKNTGIAYIPKKNFLDKNGKEQFLDVQIQLLQVFSNDSPATDVELNINNGYSSVTGEETLDATDVTTTIQVAEPNSLKPEEINVKVNGVDEELSDPYYFDSETGELTIQAAPATLKSIEVEVHKESILSNIFGGLDVHAVSYADMPAVPGIKMKVEGDPHEGEVLKQRLRAVYADNTANNKMWQYCYGVSGQTYDTVLAQMANVIATQNAGLNLSNLERMTNVMSWNISFFPDGYNTGLNVKDSKGTTYSYSGNYFELQLKCAHIVSPNTGAVYTTNDATAGRVFADVIMHIFKVDTKNQWMIIGFLTPSKNTQTGVGLYKIPYEGSNGKAKIKKTSTNTDITSGNSGYSLANATYTIYSNAGCTTSVGTLTTDASGNTGEIELKAGTYYVKETTAPTGFTLDPTVHTLTVESGRTATLNVSDIPQVEESTNEVVNKVDKTTNGAAQGDATLAGAEFTVKYYDGQYTSDPATQGANPKRTWVLRTDENGTVSLDNDHKVSGDGFYLSSGGVPVFPIGTITVQETKAPTGYLLDNTVQVRQIKSKDQGMSENINDYVTVVSQDQIITGQFKIIKTIATGDSTQIAQPEEGGEFVVVAKKYVDKYGSVEEAIKHKDEFTDMEWDILTTNVDGEAVSRQLAYGDYVIKQTKAPEEINKLEEPFDFTVKQANQTIKRYMINNIPSKYYVRMVKQDADTGEYVSLGATSFKIKNTKTNEYVTQKVGQFTYDTFTTASSREDGIPEGSFVAVQDTPGTVSTPLTLPSGKYQLEEIQVPSGYLAPESALSFEVKESKVAEIGEDNVPVIEVVMENIKPTGKIVLSKTFETHPTENNPVATFQLTAGSTIFNPATGEVLYNEGDVVKVNGNEDGLYTTNTNGKIEISGLPLSDGTATYKLKEASTTDGYVLDNNEYTFTFAMTDTVTQEYTISENIENILTTTEISKQDIGGEEVPGAQLQILDDQGKVVEEWTSTETPHIVKGLTVGKTYTLHEKVAADGYVIANDVEFTIENTEETQHVKMVDEQTFVNKFDGKQIPIQNAKLEVVNADGDVVDFWTTNGTTHAVSGLKVGATYTLQETEAPEGYVQALPITFTIEDDEQNQTITMYDKQVLFDKRDDEQNFVEGATIEVTNVNGDVVDTWTTGKDYHAISGLTAGETYTLTETETPEGYVTAEPQTFLVTSDYITQIMTMVDKQVFFTKLDSQSQMVEGAKMQVLDGQGEVVDSWTTGTETYAVNGLQDGQSYTLREIEAPKGYVRAEDVEFSVPKGQDEQAIVDQNLAMTDVVESVKKVDQFGRPVNGAKLQVTSPDGTIIYDEWTTGQSLVTLSEEQKAELETNGSLTWEGSLNTEPYSMTKDDEQDAEIVQEEQDENILVKAMNKITRAINDGEAEEDTNTEEEEQPSKEEPAEPAKMYQFTMRMIDSSTVVTNPEDEMAQQNVTNGVQEYELKAIDEEGNYYYFTIDENGNETSHRISNLDSNTDYVLKEVEAPANHAVSPDINFTTLDNQDQTVEMKDTKLDKVEISKVDIADGKELPGAELKVTDKDGNVVDEWTSTEEPHIIENLVVGEEYTLTEVTAPEFYELAESITFTIEDNDEEVQKITIKDEHKKEDVEITKKDLTTKGELPGAHLQVTDTEGNVIDDWVSTNEPHVIKNLLVGETYILTETIAPQYYELAESVEFTIQEGGVNRIEMYDEHKVDTVEISKQDITTKKELPGAELKVKDKDGNTVDKWTSGKTPHPIEGLLVGEEYILIETRAPKGYKVAEDVKFTVDNNGDVVQTVIMYDEQQEVKTGVNEEGPNIILPTAIGIGGLGLALIAIRKARKYSE